MEDGLKIRKVYEVDCCRCGKTNRFTQDSEMPLINKVVLSSLDINGNVMPEFGGEIYYICDDCWNDLLDFFKRK